MRTRTLIATGLVAAVAAGTAAPSVAAAKPKPTPKPFTTTYSVTDATPDPSGNTAASDAEHCKGKLPMEAPIQVKVPGPGDLDASIAITGDWTLMITDANGEVLAGADVNPPEAEATSARVKKAQTLNVYACNLAGAPTAKLTVHYAYRK